EESASPQVAEKERGEVERCTEPSTHLVDGERHDLRHGSENQWPKRIDRGRVREVRVALVAQREVGRDAMPVPHMKRDAGIVSAVHVRPGLSRRIRELVNGEGREES